MDEEQILDLEFALKKIEGNQQLLKALIVLYLKTQSKTENYLDQAMESTDRDQIRYHAHYIRSSLSNIGARAAAGTALILEKQAQQAGFEEIKVSIDKLQGQLKGIRLKLAELGYEGNGD